MKSTKRKKQIDVLIAKLHKYKKELSLESYSDECVINDIIYFLGLSFNQKKYEFLSGYREFLKEVQKATKILPNKTVTKSNKSSHPTKS
jgi:hypothetical protein